MHDIAIVGMACRFPGAQTLDEYWDLLLGAHRQFRAVPPQRWDHAEYLDTGQRGKAGTAYTDQVAFLDDIDQFAATHFRISTQRAREMDPQQRLLLATTREAVQDAGWERDFGDRDTTGVYFAMSSCEYAHLNPAVQEVHAYSVPGSLLNMAATTVSQHYDLGGPSFTIDSACSSGLVALHEAIAHLRTGSIRRAIVGGAYLNVLPHSLVGFSRVGALSADGVCRPFDRRADGFVLGEGVGVVVLRPVEDAVGDGDRVYAVIRGSGIANDGTTDGPMTPRADGQVLAMTRAYADAGVAPRSVGLIEAHGTATTVGDQVELESLTRVRGARPDDQPCRLVAVKALIGHSLTSSGIAGLIKSTLAVHHGVIPPQPATEPAPSVDIAALGFEIPVEPTPWRAGELRRAAVNSFAFGGTNVHVVLEQAPPALTAPATTLTAPATTPLSGGPAPELLLLSAGSVELLVDYAQALLARIDERMPLPDLARTLGSRAALPCRLSIVADSHRQLREQLATAAAALTDGRSGALCAGVFAATASKRALPVAFVYAGQGSQRPNLLRDLYDRYPAFADALRRHDVAARSAGPDVLDAVYGSDADTAAGRRRMRATEMCQPLLGSVSLAATELLRSAGVTPDLTVGHSVGEFCAGAAAGVLDAESAVRMLAVRGAAMAAAEAGDPGGMTIVQGDAHQLAILADSAEDVWVACYNHPRQLTFSGALGPLSRLEERCAGMRLSFRRLDVAHAFHSPLLDGIREPVRAALAGFTLAAPQRRFVSTVAGKVLEDPREIQGCWREHASAPVRFDDAVRAAYDAGARIFVQVSGGRSLLGMVRQNLTGHDDVHLVATSADEPDATRSFLEALGQLAALGAPVRLPDAGHAQHLLTLPPAPLLTRSYWLKAPDTGTVADSSRPDAQPVRTVAPAETAEAADPADREDEIMKDLIGLFREQVAALAAHAPGAGSAMPVPAVATTAFPPLPALPTPPHVSRAEVRQHLHTQVARISGFGAGDLRDDHLIVQDLGFDSLLFAELIAALGATFPALATWPSGAPRRPTLAEIVDVIVGQISPVDAGLAAVVAGVALVERGVEPAVAAVPASLVEREDGIAAWSDLRHCGEALRELGRNPFFLVHEGNIRDTTRIAGRELVSFSSYNYLGLSGHPAVNAAVAVAVDRYGTSVSASRFLSGDRPLHRELESELAGLLGTEDAVVMVSGHATNVSVIGELVGPGDLIVHDELAHDSIMQGCALSGATRRPFAHNDPAALDAVLTRLRPRHRRALVVVEGVYSMDGDIADLPALIEVKNRHGAVLMVDEAHSIGTIGPSGGGVGDHFAIDRSSVDLWAGTMSKALASCGGYVGGSRQVVEYLKYAVPGFVYSVGMTPPNTAAALAAIRTMRAEPERLARLHENAAHFLRLAKAAGLDTGTAETTPVVPCIVGNSADTLELAHALFDRGISVNPIMYPAVPDQLARLRFFVTSEHTADQLEFAVRTTAQELDRIRSTSVAARVA